MIFPRIEGDILKKDFDVLITIKDILSVILKSRNEDIYNNIQRVQAYVYALSTTIKNEKLPGHENLSDQVILTLVAVSQLHDIGKVGIPDSILLKPGPLTLHEFETMKTHVGQGESIINEIENKLALYDNSYLHMAKKAIISHHEWWDGKGYPSGLKGEQIPIEGRILAVADVYDALRCKRVYKPELDHDTVMEMMLKEEGTHFDPAVIKAFKHTQMLFKNISNYGNQT